MKVIRMLGGYGGQGKVARRKDIVTLDYATDLDITARCKESFDRSALLCQCVVVSAQLVAMTAQLIDESYMSCVQPF